MAVGMSLDLMDRGQILQIHQKVGAISRAQIGTEARRPLCLSSPRYPILQPLDVSTTLYASIRLFSHL